MCRSWRASNKHALPKVKGATPPRGGKSARGGRPAPLKGHHRRAPPAPSNGLARPPDASAFAEKASACTARRRVQISAQKMEDCGGFFLVRPVTQARSRAGVLAEAALGEARSTNDAGSARFAPARNRLRFSRESHSSSASRIPAEVLRNRQTAVASASFTRCARS